MYAQSRQFHHMDRQSQHNLLELHIESGSTCQDMVFFLTVVIVKMTIIQTFKRSTHLDIASRAFFNKRVGAISTVKDQNNLYFLSIFTEQIYHLIP